jgi:hypothetical protein
VQPEPSPSERRRRPRAPWSTEGSGEGARDPAFGGLSAEYTGTSNRGESGTARLARQVFCGIRVVTARSSGARAVGHHAVRRVATGRRGVQRDDGGALPSEGVAHKAVQGGTRVHRGVMGAKTELRILPMRGAAAGASDGAGEAWRNGGAGLDPNVARGSRVRLSSGGEPHPGRHDGLQF